MGRMPDTYQVSLSGSAWQTQIYSGSTVLSPTATIALSPCSQQDLTVVVDVPRRGPRRRAGSVRGRRRFAQQPGRQPLAPRPPRPPFPPGRPTRPCPRPATGWRLPICPATSTTMPSAAWAEHLGRPARRQMNATTPAPAGGRGWRPCQPRGATSRRQSSTTRSMCREATQPTKHRATPTWTSSRSMTRQATRGPAGRRMPEPLSGMAVAAYGGKLYVFGGNTPEGDLIEQDVCLRSRHGRLAGESAAARRGARLLRPRPR